VPIIAIAPCSKLADYQQAVLRAGGDARVLDRTTDQPADVIRSAGGLLLAGGGDVLTDGSAMRATPVDRAA